MAVAKRPGREKLSKIEQRKVGGLEWEPQVKQTALLAGPIYIGQAQGEKNISKEEPKPSSLSLQRDGAIFSSRLWIALPSRLKDGFSCYYLNKIEL